MLTIKNINKRYYNLAVLKDISISFPDYGFVSIVGESGCGKSSLLNVIGGIDNEYQGYIYYQGKKINNLIRKGKTSYIFQSFHLISFLKANANVRLYDFFHHSSYKENKQSRISSFKNLKPALLSLGQRQRIAILRSLYFEPDIILCDEPTASLDNENIQMVMKELKRLSYSRLIIFVSHDRELVDKYSDEIYQMNDGEIVDHKVINHPCKEKKESSYQQKYQPVIIKLTAYLISSMKKRLLEMSLSLIIAMISIMLMFTCSFSFRSMLNGYIQSMFPQSAISFKTGNVYRDFHEAKAIEHVFYYPNEYTCLGLSFEADHYIKNSTLYIHDETGAAKNIIIGKTVMSHDEIVLPYPTAKKLAVNLKPETLINKTVYAYYKYRNQVKGYPLKIVGISSQKPDYDAFYQKKFANIEHLKVLFKKDISSNIGILYYQDETDKVLRMLNKTYPSMQFKVVGEKTRNSMNKTMNMIEIILLIFSLLAVFSSLAMIHEIIKLLISNMKRDFSIMMCFGARYSQIIRMFMYLIDFVFILSGSIAYMGFQVILGLCNEKLIPSLLHIQFKLIPNNKLIFSIYAFIFILVLLSGMIPMISILRMNISEGIKGSST